MAEPQSKQFDLKLDPTVYTPDPSCVRTWPDYIYDIAGTSQDRRFRRAYISIVSGAALYLAGFLLALPIDFAATYATTPGTYFVIVAFIFFIGRWRSMSLQLIPLSASLRDIFAIPDKQYAVTLNSIGRRATNPWAVTLFTVLLLGIGWGVIAIIDFVPGSVAAVYTSEFPYPFPLSWFTGSNLLVKMLISDLLTTAVVCLATPIIYATAVSLPALFFAFRKWEVIPVPAHVSIRCKKLTTYFLIGGLYYAIGITTALFATGGNRDPLIIGVTALLMVFGLISVLAPIVLTNQLIQRSQEQLAAAVAGAYYSNLFPVALSHADEATNEQTPGQSKNFDELRELQEVLSAAAKTKGIESQFGAIIAAVLSQSLPLLRLLLPLLPK